MHFPMDTQSCGIYMTRVTHVTLQTFPLHTYGLQRGSISVYFLSLSLLAQYEVLPKHI